MNITIKISIFELVYTPSFILGSNFSFLDQICLKKLFSEQNRKGEHHHQISVDAKFLTLNNQHSPKFSQLSCHLLIEKKKIYHFRSLPIRFNDQLESQNDPFSYHCCHKNNTSMSIAFIKKALFAVVTAKFACYRKIHQ